MTTVCSRTILSHVVLYYVNADKWNRIQLRYKAYISHKINFDSSHQIHRNLVWFLFYYILHGRKLSFFFREGTFSQKPPFHVHMTTLRWAPYHAQMFNPMLAAISCKYDNPTMGDISCTYENPMLCAITCACNNPTLGEIYMATRLVPLRGTTEFPSPNIGISTMIHTNRNKHFCVDVSISS